MVDKKVKNEKMKNFAEGSFAKIYDSIKNGYDIEHEAEADELGVKLMAKAGYDPKEAINVLEKLKKVTNSYGGANYPEDRKERISDVIASLSYDEEKTLKNKKLRTKRFKKYR